MSRYSHTGLLLAALTLLAPACGSDTGAETPAGPETVSIGVRVVPVRRGDITSVVAAVGTLHASRQAMISSRVPGRIDEFPFDVGDQVDAGTLLLQLEQEEFRLAVRQAAAAVGSAEARLEGAQRAHQRVNALSAHSIASTEQQDTAQTELAIAQAVVREARAALDIAKDRQAQSTIVAPFSGSVAMTHANAGERISPGQTVLHLVNLDIVTVDVTVSEKRVADIKIGQHVRVRVDGFSDETFQGNVQRLSPTVDPVSRTFIATMVLTNPDHRLLPGMFARVEIQVGARQDTLVLDRAGILEQTGELWAVRVRDGRAERVKLTPGYRYGDDVEILAGLDLDDRVVTEGAYGLGNGAAVHVRDEG